MIMWKLLSCNEFNQEPTNWLSSVGCRVSYARSFSFTWTVTSTLEYKIDGAYTRVLCAALNKSWKNHPTNKELYGNILSSPPPPSLSASQYANKDLLDITGAANMNQQEIYYSGGQAMANKHQDTQREHMSTN